MNKTIKNIINFVDTYKSDKSHDKVWLEAQVGNQLEYFRQEIELKERERIKGILELLIDTSGVLHVDWQSENEND